METLATGAWLTRARIIRIAALCGLASIVSLAWLFLTAHGALDYQGRALGTDFSNVWAAGKMALGGNAADVWEPAKFAAMQRAMPGGDAGGIYIWVYPPPFLLVAALLATLPYIVALILWQLATLAALAWTLHRLVPKRETVLLALAAPATLICLTHGQNGFLTALLLGGGLVLLDRRPFIAGLLFGCLIYKPQFGLILPVLLLAGRHWRAIAGAIASSAMLIVITLAIWGWPVWQAFFTSMTAAQHIVVEQGGASWYKLMSPFAAVRMWGGTIGAAYALQALATATAILTVGWAAWKKPVEIRNALVCAAALIATPYVFDYDFVVLLPAIAFLALDGERNGWLSWEKSLLALAWIGPLAARQVAHLTSFPFGLVIAFTVAAIAVRRALRHRHSAVDVQRLSGDVTRLAAGEIDAGRADIVA
jgi:hypothetical protein